MPSNPEAMDDVWCVYIVVFISGWQLSGRKNYLFFYFIKDALLTTILQLCSWGKKGNAPEVRANTESPRGTSLEELNFLRKLPISQLARKK